MNMQAKWPGLLLLLLGGLLGASGQAQAQLDTKPPRLTAFEVSGAVDAARSGQGVTVSFTANDNLSGVYYYVITLKSPNGQQVVQEGLNAAASLSFRTKVALGYPRYANIEFGEHFGRWSDPGVWWVESLDVRDAAGNAKVYDRAALAALGNTEFTLTNTRADSTPPTLLSGVLETRSVSLAVPYKGTANKPPMVFARITAQDAGNPSAAGLDVYSAYFCKLPFANNRCDDAFGIVGLTGTPVVAATSLVMSDSVVSARYAPATVKPGVYYLMSITLSDVAGNSSSYLGNEFGGDVDWATFFPTGSTVTVNP